MMPRWMYIVIAIAVIWLVTDGTGFGHFVHEVFTNVINGAKAATEK